MKNWMKMKFRPKGASVHPTDGDILCKYLEYINWYNMHCVLLLSKFSGSNYLLDLSINKGTAETYHQLIQKHKKRRVTVHTFTSIYLCNKRFLQ